MRKFRIRRGLVLAGAAASLLLVGTQVSLPAGAATTAQQDDPSLASCADFQPSGWHYGDATSGANAAQFTINLSGKVGKACSGDTYVLYLYDQTMQCVGGASLPGVGCTGQVEPVSTQIAQTTYTAKDVWGQSSLAYNYNWCSSGCSFTGPPPGSPGDTTDTLCIGVVTVGSNGSELDGAPRGAGGADWSPSNSNGCLVVQYGSGGGGNQFY